LIPKILEIRGNEVVQSIATLTLKPFTALEKHCKKDYFNMLKVLYFYFPDQDNPFKAFINTPEEERLEKIIKNFDLDNKILENQYFKAAFDFMIKENFSTLDRFFLSSKTNLENLSVWAATPVTDGQGGNVKDKMTYSKQMLDMYLEHANLEEEVKKVMNKSRGNKKIARDADKNYG